MRLKPTERGFLIGEFTDAYDLKCSIQKSSSVAAHIWLGVHEPTFKILARDAMKMGRADLLGEGPERYNGWVNYPIPKDVLVSTRMHLNKKMVRELIPLLIRFLETGELDAPKKEKKRAKRK